MKQQRITILSESSYDYKYQNIFSRLRGITVIEGGIFTLLKHMVKPNAYYHIRYIKYRGKTLTILRILIISIFSIVLRSKIIWSCHNIYEHNIPSKRYNDIIRVLLSLVSYKIVIFHKDLSAYLPQFSQKKIIISSFGDFTNYMENKKKTNALFLKKYSIWLNKNDVMYPDLISVSAANKNNIELLIKGLDEIHINTLIIAPSYQKSTKTHQNVFLYTDFVHKEVASILYQARGLIGFVGHTNISVPTSLYMYASYGVPIIGINIKPISSIINENKLGIVVDDKEELLDAIKLIKNNYHYYQNNCRLFLENNSWENASRIHENIFK